MVLAAGALVGGALGFGGPPELPAGPGTARAAAGAHWVATWAAAPQAASVRTPFALRGVHDQTIRDIVFAAVGGSMLRVQLSNAYGRRPLRVGAVAVAGDPGGGASLSGREVRLRFRGRGGVTIPPGSQVWSDPVGLEVPQLRDLAVSVYLPGATGPATLHTLADQATWLGTGDAVMARRATAFTGRLGSWLFVSGVSVLAPPSVRGTVVAFGDSITDGVHAGVDANRRYPNDLARRLATVTGPRLSVVDEGIAGNRLLTGSPCYGPSGLSRFRRDVLTQPGVRAAILLEGTNDIGMGHGGSACTAPHRPVSAAQLIAGDESIIRLAHRHGVRVFGGTLLPFRGAHYWTPAGERVRTALNRWIRTGHAFDGVVDFAAAVADPQDPQVLAPRYDGGDHLHPNDAGYRAMAQAVRLGMLTVSPGSTDL